MSYYSELGVRPETEAGEAAEQLLEAAARWVRATRDTYDAGETRLDGMLWSVLRFASATGELAMRPDRTDEEVKDDNTRQEANGLVVELLVNELAAGTDYFPANFAKAALAAHPDMLGTDDAAIEAGVDVIRGYLPTSNAVDNVHRVTGG